MPLCRERLLKALRYDPDTGQWTWLISKRSFAGKVRPGAQAGTTKDGYIHIIFEQRSYRAHRLAWFVIHGIFPPKGFEIDHINGNRSDNRISNLRLVTRSQNNMNGTLSRRNKSGYRGVSRHVDGKWDARITKDGQVHLLGLFPTAEAAAGARHDAELRLFGRYSSLQRHEQC